eukprot:6436374-Amphidinium_carterae.1
MKQERIATSTNAHFVASLCFWSSLISWSVELWGFGYNPSFSLTARVSLQTAVRPEAEVERLSSD